MQNTKIKSQGNTIDTQDKNKLMNDWNQFLREWKLLLDLAVECNCDKHIKYYSDTALYYTHLLWDFEAHEMI